MQKESPHGIVGFHSYLLKKQHSTPRSAAKDKDSTFSTKGKGFMSTFNEELVLKILYKNLLKNFQFFKGEELLKTC